MNPADIAAIVGLPIKNQELFETALTHKSFANEHTGISHNERLEFLGDAVLELAVTEHLFRLFPDEPEGKMTKFRSALVSGISLALVTRKLGIAKFIRLSKGETASGGINKNPILANMFEALVGALFLDSGMPAVNTFLDAHLYPQLPDVVEKRLYVDPKSGFQEWSQEMLEITPEYRVLDESGPDHDKRYLVGAFVGDKLMGEGEGSSKQKAEVAAAENALENIGEEGKG